MLILHLHAIDIVELFTNCHSRIYHVLLWNDVICTLFILYVSVSLVSFTMVCICIKLTVFYFKIDVSSSSVKILFLLKIYTSCRFHCFRPILYFLMNLKQYSIPCFRHFSDVRRDEFQKNMLTLIDSLLL
jgi:hypothetical protein